MLAAAMVAEVVDMEKPRLSRLSAAMLAAKLLPPPLSSGRTESVKMSLLVFNHSIIHSFFNFLPSMGLSAAVDKPPDTPR